MMTTDTAFAADAMPLVTSDTCVPLICHRRGALSALSC